MPDAPVKVPWIVARRRALARVMAMHAHRARGLEPWTRLSAARQDSLVDAAEAFLRECAAGGVMVEFMRDYAEPAGGGKDPTPEAER